MSFTFLTGPLQNRLKVLAAGLKTYQIPPDYSGNKTSRIYYLNDF